MAVTTKRETILEYLRTTTLPLINGTGNYNLTLKTVTRNFKKATDYINYPAVCIIDDLPVGYQRLASTQEHTVGSVYDVHDGMYVILAGYVKLTTNDSGNTGKLSTEMNKMFSDLMIAMYIDISLGGNVDSTTLIASRNSLDWAEQGIGTVIQTYAIKYDFDPTASTPIT